MRHLKTFEHIEEPRQFSHIKQYREKRPPMIGDYVRFTDEFYDNIIGDTDYVTRYNRENKIYRIAVGQIIDYNEDTKEYKITFDKYEFWKLKILATIDDIRSYAENRVRLENLPMVGDYVILGGGGTDYICKVLTRKRSELRWTNFDYVVKRLEIGIHGDKDIINTSDESIKHFSKNKEDLERIITANKYNI
jgi:hypothetical protein